MHKWTELEAPTELPSYRMPGLFRTFGKLRALVHGAQRCRQFHSRARVRNDGSLLVLMLLLISSSLWAAGQVTARQGSSQSLDYHRVWSGACWGQTTIAVTSGLDVATVELARQIAKDHGYEVCVDVRPRMRELVPSFAICERGGSPYPVQRALFENEEFNRHALFIPVADWNLFPEPPKPYALYDGLVPPDRVAKDLGEAARRAYSRAIPYASSEGETEGHKVTLLAVVVRGALRLWPHEHPFDFYVGYGKDNMIRWQVLPEGPVVVVGRVPLEEQPQEGGAPHRVALRLGGSGPTNEQFP